MLSYTILSLRIVLKLTVKSMMTKTVSFFLISTCLFMLFIGLMVITKPVNADKTQNKLQNSVATSESNKLKYDSIIVGGGCFWCVESDFEPIEGVLRVTSGYINGNKANPTYKQVSTKKTGHYEVVKIEFDDSVVSAKELLDYFWQTIDPTDDGGQFCDRGSPYKTGLFYQNAEQKKLFDDALVRVKQTKPFKANIVTPVLEAQTFYLAEDYHQDYYLKNPRRYKYYRNSCRRDKTVERLWGKVVSKKYH